MSTTDTTPTQVARWFHALSDETRLRIIAMLQGGECCVCDLQESVGAAQSRLSFHLKVLREAGLVDDRKQGRWNFYSLRTDVLDEMSEYLQERKPDENTLAACACGESHQGQCCD
jgi:ArsR family transcriptional regulator